MDRKPGVLQSMESQSIGHDLATEQQMTNDVELCFMSLLAIHLSSLGKYL